MKLSFRAFRAIDEPDTCQQYVEAHVKVLTDYGITKITSNNNRWMSNPNVYGVVAELEPHKEIVGGIRLQIADNVDPLPVEAAIGHIDPKIHEIVKEYMVGGVGELCGLWISKKVAGRGVSMLLTRAGISIINQVNIEILVGICGHYTLEMFSKVGFVIDRSLGNKGEFLYPKEGFIAWVLGILNAKTLQTASEYDRKMIAGLRDQPVQTRIEKGNEGEETVEVSYNLIIPSLKK
jgi:hypothetical protein